MNVILVEGFHDAALVSAICAQVFADREFRIEQIGGLPRPTNDDARLNSIVTAWILIGEVESVGLVVDADDDPDRVKRRLRRLIVLKNTTPESDPNAKPEDGYVATYRVGTVRKKFGLWIMPDNCRAGQLEDFVIRMIPDTDRVEQPAREFIGDLPEEIVDNASHKAAKHIAHAWLSAYYPGWSFDDALKSGQLVYSSDDPVLGAFKRWLRRLAR